MMHFKLTFSMYGTDVDTAYIELNGAVIEVVDDEWRSVFYDLRTPEEIAAHIGYNLFVNRRKLSMLDGWADQPDENARILIQPDLGQWEIRAERIKDDD